VVEISSETRVEVLRQVALLQQREIERLHQRIVELVAELAAARGEDAHAALQQELVHLQEQLAAARHKLFGRSSERRPAQTPAASSSTSAGEGQTPSPLARPGHGPRTQPTLPRIEVIHTLDLPDQACPRCGGELVPMDGQFEEHEEIDVIERSYRIVQHRRQKYRCGCGQCIDTALGPDKPIRGGRYSIDFGVHVAVAKYLDHLPLARQVRQMARAGLVVDSQTLWDQLNALAHHLDPTYQALHGHVLSVPVIGADETTWPLLEKGGSKNWYAWAAVREDAVIYRIAGSRSADAAQALLSEYQGVVMCDGYRAYTSLEARHKAWSSLEGKPSSFALAHCWAHVRRKLFDAEKAYPEAKLALEWIGDLYRVEREVRENTSAEDLPRALAQARHETSRPIVERLRDWLLQTPALSESQLGKAIHYADGIWSGLVRFLEDPDIPLDNNSAERALRGVVLGRKNHYGSKSKRGTEVAALFYSLLESAKLADVEPARYLAEAARRAIASPGSVTLPRDLLAAPAP
jgi:transposase